MTLAWIGRHTSTERLVVIAPHGRDYHRLNPALLIAAPACKTRVARWVTVDDEFAHLLDRQACQQCWPEEETNGQAETT